MKKVKVLAGIMALTLSALTFTGCGSSQEPKKQVDFPTKPIKLIVPFSPGGMTDTASRALSSVVHKYLPNGQSVVVENKDGAGGAIGLTDVFEAKADGYTIGMATVGSMTIKPLSGQTAYKPDGFKPIIQVVATPNVFVVQKDAPWKTFEEWFEYVKANPEKMTYGTSGAGLTQHITMESFNTVTGAKLKHVPFKGSAPALTALLGGNVQGALVQSTDAMAQIKAGKVRPLFLTGTFKTKGLEDIPLLTEKNIKVGGDVWTGLVATKDVPDEVIAILHDAFKKALEDPEVVAQFKKIGADPVYANSADFKTIIASDYQKNAEILKAAGLMK